jgi:hypothetical protein
MKRISIICIIALVVVCANVSRTQQTGQSSVKMTSNDDDSPSSIIKDPATERQVREYLRVSGDADEFRKSWIAAVDKNHSIGAPYWPESFFQAVKDEMKTTDLAPMYVALFQHGVSRKLMQEVLDAYRERGREHFSGSPECFKLGAAMAAVQDEYEKLKLAETQAVFSKVYDEYKPQIKAARARYLEQHPDFKDK